MSIPKRIHYCWFGTKEKPELVKRCIYSWRKFLPDYEVREWNNYDLAKCTVPYVIEAAQEKKWAFVSDYFRLYALYNEGGIYLDSDNEVFKSFDDFLNLKFFTGFEDYKGVIAPFTAVVGAEKGNLIIKALLDEYKKLHFILENGDVDMTTNTKRVEEYFKQQYMIKHPYNSKKKLYLEEESIIFPEQYFCNYDADVSYAVHHFNGSWVPDLLGYKRKTIFGKIYIKIYTITKGQLLKQIKNIPELPIFIYPRIDKRNVVVSIGYKKDK